VFLGGVNCGGNNNIINKRYRYSYIGMEWNAKTQQWAIVGAVVIVAALGGWWFFTGAGTNQTDDTVTPSENSTETSITSNSNDGRPTVAVNTGEEVSVDDQPAGDSVRVVEAKLSRVSWVAVSDDMRIYGAARVTPPQGGGTVNDITVPLLRNTESGKTYSVVVYADDGDGAFDFKKDALVSGLDDTFSALNGD